MTVELYSQDSIFNAGLTSVQAITQLIDPIYDTDVATKYYVDHVIDVLQTDPRFDTSVKPLTAIPVATDEILGGVKIGNDLTITLDGVLSVIPPRMLPLSGGVITGSLSVLSSITLPNNQIINNTTQPFLTSIPYATSAVAGIVKIGEGIRIANDSTISVTQFSGLSSTGGNVYGDVTVFGIISANELRGTLANLQVASETQTGVVRVGANLYIDDESRLNAFAPYILTPASKSVLGGIIAGNGIFVDTSGVISTSSLPLSGGTLTGALTGTRSTFVTSVSSPALSGTHYGDGSNLAGVIAAGGIATDPTKLPLAGGTLSGPLVGTAATFSTSVSAPAVRGKHYGDGSSLTGIIAAGGIATDTTKLPLIGGTLTGSLIGTVATFSTSVSAPALSGTHFGDGSKLTGVIASGGTATDSTKLPLIGGTLTGALTGDRGVFTVSLSAPNLSGTHHGDGSNLTGVIKTQYVPPANAVFTSSVSAPSLSGTHYGDGSNLLGVIKTQYVPPANAVFTLSVSSPMLSGTHYGDGSNLQGVVKTQYVPPANAVFTTSVSAPALSGVFYGDGRYLQNVPIYDPPPTATFTISVSSPSVSGTHYGDGSNLTGITKGNYLSATGGTLSGSLVIKNNLTIQGNIIAAGTSTFVNTTFTTTSALSVVNISPVSGVPAMYIGQSGPGDIASFFDIDRNVEILHVGGINSLRPNVGVHTSTPNKTLTVNGEISASNDIWTSGYFRGDGSQLTGIIPAGGIVDNTKLPLTGGTLTGDLYVNSKSFLNGDVFVGRQNSVSEGGQISLARASDNTGNWNIDVFGTGSTPRLRIHKDLGGEKMTILDNGNIGIGTSVPTYMLDVVGNIRSVSEIVSNSPSGNQFRAISGNYGVIFRNDGTNFYLLPTNSSDQYGSWNSLRPFAFNVSTGDVNLGHNVTIGGNVGIGTLTPQYKLDVVGDIISSSWLRTRGNTGWFNETHGGGWYMTDSTYIRNYNSKQLRLDNNLIVDSKIGIGTTTPAAKLHISGGSTYVTSSNNVGIVFAHSHNYATKAYNGNTWYRFFTFQATNQGQTATIILRNPNGHDSVEIKLSKHTTGSLGSQIGITAEVRRLGAYTYNYNIARLRIVDEGVNQATHLEFQIGASTTTDFYLGVQGFVNSTGFVIPEMTTIESGSFATKELFISNGVQGSQNHTVLGISTFTKDLLYINGSGNIGIGTSTPASRLSVAGDVTVGNTISTGLGASTDDCAIEIGASRIGNGNAYVDLHSVAGTDYEARLLRNGGIDGNLFLVNTGIGNFNIYQQGAGPIIFGTTNSERMRISSNGFVGIGTSTPGNHLEIKSAGESYDIVNVLTRNSGTGLGKNASLTLETGVLNSSIRHTLYNSSANNKSTYQVTAGTGVDIVFLDMPAVVFRGVSDSGTRLSIGSSGTYIHNSLSVGRQDGVSEGGDIGLARSIDNLTYWHMDAHGSDYTPRLRFYSQQAEHATILANGNFGIGTSTPSYKLDVNGIVRATGTVFASSSNQNQLQAVSTNYGVVFRNDNTNFWLLPTAQNDPYGGYHLTLRPFSFNLSTGRVTLGNGVDVTGDSFLNGEVKIGRQNTSGTEGAQITLCRGSDNAIDWNIDVVGGGTDTRLRIHRNNLGEQMTITNNSNVGIGTSTPDRKLTVNGDIGFSGYIYGDGSKLTGISSGGGGLGLDGVQIGTIDYFPFPTPPTGYLECNGTTVSQATYSDLFQAIGTRFNTGGEPTGTFRLPDLRSEFIRGWDNGRGVDAGRVLGSNQAGTHIVGDEDTSPTIYTISNITQCNGDPGDSTSRSFNRAKPIDTVSHAGVYWRQTRPRNVALLPCIKALKTLTGPTTTLNFISKPANATHEQVLTYNSANASWVATTPGNFIPTAGGNLTGTLNGTSTARLVFGQTSLSISDGVVTPVLRATNLYGDGSGLTNVILRTGGSLDGTITGTNNARLTLGATNISTADGITTTTLRATNLYGDGTNITGVLLLAGGTITGNLGVNGKIIAKGDISSDGDVIAFATSDKNLKKDIVNIPNSLDKLTKINGVYFNWIDRPGFVGTDVGVIAQDVEEVLPEIVTTRANGDKAVQYDKLIPLLIESIKELKNQVDDLKVQIKNK